MAILPTDFHHGHQDFERFLNYSPAINNVFIRCGGVIIEFIKSEFHRFGGMIHQGFIYIDRLQSKFPVITSNLSRDYARKLAHRISLFNDAELSVLKNQLGGEIKSIFELNLGFMGLTPSQCIQRLQEKRDREIDRVVSDYDQAMSELAEYEETLLVLNHPTPHAYFYDDVDLTPWLCRLHQHECNEFLWRNREACSPEMQELRGKGSIGQFCDTLRAVLNDTSHPFHHSMKPVLQAIERNEKKTLLDWMVGNALAWCDGFNLIYTKAHLVHYGLAAPLDVAAQKACLEAKKIAELHAVELSFQSESEQYRISQSSPEFCANSVR